MRSKNFILFSFIFFLISCTPTYIVTFSGSTGGTVSDVGGEFDEGTVISVTAQPDTGYDFQGWSDGSNQNPRTITVSESINLIAQFSKQQINLNLSIQGSGSVVDSNGGTPSTYDFGTIVELTPKPDEGYFFIGWEVSYQPSESLLDSNLSSFLSELQAAISKANLQIQARSARLTEFNTSIIQAIIDLNALPQSNANFELINNLVESGYNELNTYTIRVPMITDLSIKAKFEKRSYVALFSSNGNGGLRMENEEFNRRLLFQPFQTQLQITAEPNQGWEFDNWIGDIESEDNPIIVVLDKNLSVSAEFIRKKFDLNVSVEGEGTVTEEVVVQPSQYDYETQVKLTATAEEYWEFIEWSGDVDSNENPLIVTIDNTKSLSAKFAKKDSDNDGVTDDIDQCPNTPEDVAVDENGCALDSDNDGVNDDIDLCLDTPEGAEVDSNGCAASQKDSDNDGVTDDKDQCANTPEGSEVDSNGCAASQKDSDNDGVTDDKDQCANTPEEDRVNASGCSIPPIKIHSNGITIVAEDWAEVGTAYTLNGKTYTIVNRQQLDDMINKGQDLSLAVTSKITNFRSLFFQRTLSDINIETWDTSNVTDMTWFAYQSNFDADISHWDVRKVTTLNAAFASTPFSGDISSWQTDSLRDLASAFSNTTEFNSDLNNWNVSKVLTMQQAFGNADGFNKPLDKWDVSNVTNMNYMFRFAESFNQDLTSWCVELIPVEPLLFTSSDSALEDSNKPKWGTCPYGSSTDTGSGGDSAGDTSGNISFIRFSEAKACINNVCDVTLGMRFSNGTTESITVNKIEVYTNGSLTTTYTSGDALGSYAAGQAKSFSISLDNATSGKVIVYYTASGVSGTKEYNWTNN